MLRPIASAPLLALLLVAAVSAQPAVRPLESAAADAAAAPPASPAAVQQAPCAGDGRHRDFDFWAGTWAVFNPQGQRIGTNVIEPVSAGCALLEQWQPVRGLPGRSLNFYDPDRDRWQQLWVGGGGLTLRLYGGVDDEGVMVLTADETRTTPQGEVLDRIRWVPEADGSVRQIWDVSADGGETWSRSFVGIYRPEADLSTEGGSPLSGAPRPLHPADPADVATPEAVVEALYASIQREPGEDYDWDRNLSLFLPSAHLIANTEQRGGWFVVHTPSEFRRLVDDFTDVGGPSDRGFFERQIAARVDRYGDVAHVLSTYEKGYADDGVVIGRGINSVQMVWNGGRWWIASVAWDEEVGAGPLPARYLGGTERDVRRNDRRDASSPPAVLPPGPGA